MFGCRVVSQRLPVPDESVTVRSSRSPLACCHDSSTLVLLLYSVVRLETAEGAEEKTDPISYSLLSHVPRHSLLVPLV